MWLQMEDGRVVEQVTEIQVCEAIMSLCHEGPNSFAILSDDQDNYIQTAGGSWGYVVERRNTMPLIHMRAYREDIDPKRVAGDIVKTATGEIPMRRDEWFRQEEVIDLFLVFLRRERYADAIRWRSMNGELGV